METHLKNIRAYMGFVSMYKHIPPRQLTLQPYQELQTFAMFISYLIARWVGRPTLLAHVGECHVRWAVHWARVPVYTCTTGRTHTL
eukprot:350331-Chlamydomonas_euryale.AAC.1